MLLQIMDESLAAVRVGIAPIHETVQVHIFQFIFLGNVAQCQYMFKRAVHAAGRSKPHEVHPLTRLLSIRECRFYFGVVKYRPVFYGFIDFHQILIQHPACTYIQVAHFRVAHLSVGQSHVFAACLKLRMRIPSQQAVPIRSWCTINYVRFSVVAYSPTIQNHQQCFFCHNIYLFYLLFLNHKVNVYSIN